MKWIVFFLFPLFLAAEPYFIFISGGSASGKSTFARTLVETLGEDRATYISLDEYLDKRIQPKNDFIKKIPNFDNPSMINWKLLLGNIAALQNGLSIETPVYDFSTWMPLRFRNLEWKPVIIIEGIHATQDHLDSIPGLRIFLDTEEDLRYRRRLTRDVSERNYSPKMSKHIFFNIAVPSQKIFLDPTRHKANLLIDNLNGRDDLKKTVDYVIRIFEKFKPDGFEKIKIKIKYQDGNLIEKDFTS